MRLARALNIFALGMETGAVIGIIRALIIINKHK